MVKFAGLELKNPFVVASGPLTADIEQIKLAEKYGAAAVSIKQVMTRQTFKGQLRAYSSPGNVLIFPIDKRLSVEEGLDLVRKAKEHTSIAIIVNLSSQEPDIEEYGRLARRFEQVGADAIEINLCCPNFSLGKRQLGMDIVEDDVETGAIIGQNPHLSAAITKIIKDSVSIPVIPKLTPTALDVGQVAWECEKAGADGLSLVGGPSLTAPPVDIYNGGKPLYPLMNNAAFGATTGSAIRFATFKVTAQVAQRVRIPLVSSGGIDKWRHAIEMMMWGATAVSACTAIMWYGFEVISKILAGMDKFLEEQGYASYDDIIGISLKYLTSTDQLDLVPGHALVNPDRCNGCGLCLRPGHCSAIVMEEGKAIVVSKQCIGCGICASICPKKAITISAQTNLKT